MQRQKQARAAARKLAEERERKRNQRIAENLAATAEAAKLAAKRSLRLKMGKFSAPPGLKVKSIMHLIVFLLHQVFAVIFVFSAPSEPVL